MRPLPDSCGDFIVIRAGSERIERQVEPGLPAEFKRAFDMALSRLRARVAFGGSAASTAIL